jgi:hypothetical protein
MSTHLFKECCKMAHYLTAVSLLSWYAVPDYQDINRAEEYTLQKRLQLVFRQWYLLTFPSLVVFGLWSSTTLCIQYTMCGIDRTLLLLAVALQNKPTQLFYRINWHKCFSKECKGYSMLLYFIDDQWFLLCLSLQQFVKLLAIWSSLIKP